MKKEARSRPSLTSPERITGRRNLLIASFGLASLLVIGRAVQLQGFEGARWRDEAARQQQARVPLPARRGAIYDRDGVPLALTRETYEVAVAPNELLSRSEAVKQLTDALGMTRGAARRATDPRRRWAVIPGRFTVEQRRRLGDVRGVHVTRILERFYPQGAVGREVLGAVAQDGRASGGMEAAMDSILRGADGFSILRRNARGKKEASVSLPVAPPRDGGDVYLTIDFDLQEIADAALDEAIRNTGAAGGDLLLAEPRTGEILAAVSKRTGSSGGLSAFIEPYEPGSTLKPFFVAGLLAAGDARLSDQVFGENGRWTDPAGRVHTDVHPYGMLTLRDALRVSSNIGIVKFVPRTTPAEQYGVLRDFGFGTPTGVEYPVESGGRLPRPARWSRMTAASLATGYEVSVTPVQMTMAYGALANGGKLMEAHLLRETRRVGGDSWKLEPRAVRTVLPTSVTDQLREVLITVVDDGSAKAASLSTFEVAGKTGTARRTGANGRYEAGQYNSSFVSFFPARDPQLVIFVKLDRPRGDYYGGLTAAPVTRATLQAILAARSPSLDRRALLATRLASTAPQAAPKEPRRAVRASGREGTYVFQSVPAGTAPASPARDAVPVPELAGLPLRDATRRLHALGFHVRVQGAGSVKTTRPAAGVAQPRGTTITLMGAEQ